VKIHILGICGVFMAGLAILARELGHEVSGSDAGVYPPMSDQIRSMGIRLHEGYSAAVLQPPPDLVVIGNALSRGNACVEYLLDKAIPFTSGPQWLAEHVLPGRHVLAVSGTHGKTTTASLLAWLLDRAGLAPGFLVGSVAANFEVSARLGAGHCFVIEADEYDTAFFDKRSKFVHYRPHTLIINNIEFDHADIFPDLAAIRRQFHHLVRTVPSTGRLIVNGEDPEVAAVLAEGCWSPVERFGADGGDWFPVPAHADYSAFDVRRRGRHVGRVEWTQFGAHNALNGVAAIAAAAAVEVEPERSCAAAAAFRSTRRRQERLYSGCGIDVYDDFAHHPTAIRATLKAMRSRAGNGRVIALFEPRSNTMKLGVHGGELGAALGAADRIFVLRPPGLKWDPAGSLSALGDRCRILESTAAIVTEVVGLARPGDKIVIMSNGPFGGIQEILLQRLREQS
jgi:UDP-N-acetylmuramate: L-alanyl-gamma-D-glutamyl-meso-diaminopimelate ligase